MLVVHGGPDIGGSYLRGPLWNAIGDVVRLYFYDQRGTGQARMIGEGGLEAGPTMVRLARDLDLVRRHLGLAAPILAGHSFGALVVLDYVRRFPGHTRGLLLIDPDPPLRADWEAGRRMVADRRSPEDAAWLAGMGRAVRTSDPDAYHRVAFRPYFVDPSLADGLEIGPRSHPEAGSTGTGAAVRDDLGAWDLRPTLAVVEAPTLVIAGASSIFPAESLDPYARLMPRCRVVAVEGAGHFPHMERPARFREEVQAFLTSA